MTKPELEKYVGRKALWRPVLRSSDGAIAIPVTVEAVQQRYGRSETRIHPTHGTGAAWVSAESLTLTKEKP
jgi:hypothetical protein